MYSKEMKLKNHKCLYANFIKAICLGNSIVIYEYDY